MRLCRGSIIDTLQGARPLTAEEAPNQWRTLGLETTTRVTAWDMLQKRDRADRTEQEQPAAAAKDAINSNFQTSKVSHFYSCVYFNFYAFVGARS